MTAVAFSFVATIGRLVLGFFGTTGRVAQFASNAVRHCVTPPWYPRLIVRQMVSIGYFSLPVVGLTAFFTGLVLALQIYVGGSRFNAESAVVSLPLVVSAVLGGGVFGDHCSPISDTSVVSSMAAASDHIDHVRTQIPYALVAGATAFAST